MLREWLSRSDLLDLPVLATLIFMVLFLGIVVWAFLPRFREEHENMAGKPLEDEGEVK